MNNSEQIFYIQYRQSDGYLTVMTDQKHYDELSDDDRKKFIQVIVDLPHLNGWGLYWNHVRYINGHLDYPDNYPKDQSVQIDDLKKKLANIVASDQAKEKSNEDLKAQVNGANQQINQLKELASQLQLQVANQAPTSNNQGGNNNEVSK